MALILPPYYGFRGPGRAIITSGGTGGTTDGGFVDQPVTILNATGDTTIKGKVKSGSFGKFVLPLAAIAANRQYTVKYTPHFSKLAQQGKLAMVGWGMKSSNDFHIVGLRGDGSTGVHKYQVYGTPPNGWNQQTGHTVNDGGAASGSVSQAGPNYIRLITSANGATYKFQTSSDGVTYVDQFTGQTPSPFSNVSGVLTFGIALWFNNSDAGEFDILIESFADVAAPISDAFFSSVGFLFEAEGTNNQASGFVDGKNGNAITASGTGKLTNTPTPPFGTTSFSVGTGGFNLAQSSNFDISQTNSDPFTLEFSVYQTTLNQWELFQRWIGSGAQNSWWLRLQGDGNFRFLASSTGSASFTLDLTTTGFGITLASWANCCVEKNASGKLRFYREGVMKFSNTPANSAFWVPTIGFNCGANGNPNGFIRHVRFTKGAARYDSDSGYTFDASAFPTQ